MTKNVNELVENPIKIPELQARDETSMALSLSQTLNLPRIEIHKFDGNPRHYTGFMASFRQCVESITSDNHTRLSQLLYHTKGEARTAISSFINTPDGTGFDLAMKRLKSRFGSPHVICETVLSDLKDYPDAHTPPDIRQFADQLNNASVILKEHSMYSEMDTQNFILCMCLKLPVRIRYKWRYHATDSLEKRNLYPNFQDFVLFVERRASVLTDPVYGGETLSGITRRGLRPSTMQPIKKTSSFTSATKRPMCALCSKDHKLFMCSKFRDKSLSERIAYVNDNKLCYICLARTHMTNDCKSTYRCTASECMARHSKFLHVDRPNGSNINSVSVSLNAHCNVSMLMPILPVTVNGVYDTYALLDTGSSHSFCSDTLKKELKLNGPMMRYDLSTLDRTSQTESQFVHFQLTSRRNSRSVSMKHVRVTDVIPVHSASCDVTAFPHLKDICCPGDVPVDILIGQDYPHLLRPIDVRTGRDNDPFAVLTTLGWTLNGPVTSQPTKRMVSSNLISSTNIEKKLDQLYEFDAVTYTSAYSHEDLRVLQLWDKECRVVDHRFQIPIPCKDPDARLPDNLYLAKSRLSCLLKSLNRKNMYDEYNNEINKMLAAGYAEPAPIDHGPTDRYFYIPHHAVPKQHDNIRVVFDCASRCNDVSLNSLSLQGPNITSKLFDILIRFRQFPYALMADIVAMYNQVRVPPNDRDALRFLWMKDGGIQHYRMTSHLFGGVWCSSSSTYALHRVANFTSDPKINNIITSSFYVDDLMWSVSTIEDAKRCMPVLRALLLSKGFQLTKYVATNKEMLDGIPSDARLRGDEEMLLCHTDKALGVGWCLLTDSLYVKHHLRSVTTKAEMLSSLASVFDPLGLITPLHLPGKLLFQQATGIKLSWESKLPDDLIHQWNQWISSMNDISSLVITRCLIPVEFQDSFMSYIHFVMPVRTHTVPVYMSFA